ncbi:MAG: hypothetical protein M0R80_20360 [Proteobacteria bacterium]|jgi:hypothetical protein|nr:hypothetical protein [Pseudomonadota bacterium]
MSRSLPCALAALLVALAAGRTLGADAGAPPMIVEAIDAGAAAEEPAEVPPPTTDLSAIPADRRPTLKLTVEPRSGAIGDPIVWRAEIRRRVEDRVRLGSSADFGAFEVQDKKIEVGEPDDGWVAETMEVRLVAFETGALEIPAQAVSVVDAKGNVGTLATEPATIDVKSLIANEPEPKLKPDTGPGVRVFEKDYTLLWILGAIGCIAVLVLLTLLGRWLWSKRRRRPGPPPPPPRPAEEIALEKLDALRSSAHLAEGRHKLFHILLSEAIREYLGNRYRFYSLERSTEELLGELVRRRLDRAMYNRAVDFLSETDLVKFAKYVPDVPESERLLGEGFALVRDTTPQPEPPTPPPSGAAPGETGGRDA